MQIQGWHILIIIVIAILLFGAPKLPGLARSVGQSLRIFKSEVRQMKEENGSDDTAGASPVEGRVVDQPRQDDPQRRNQDTQPGTTRSTGGPGSTSSTS
jgi:sec-independent protein translocase protein TatA